MSRGAGRTNWCVYGSKARQAASSPEPAPAPAHRCCVPSCGASLPCPLAALAELSFCSCRISACVRRALFCPCLKAASRASVWDNFDMLPAAVALRSVLPPSWAGSRGTAGGQARKPCVSVDRKSRRVKSYGKVVQCNANNVQHEGDSRESCREGRQGEAEVHRRVYLSRDRGE